MMKGNLGQPPGGWPEGIQKKVLKGEKPLTERPGKQLEPVDLEATRKELAEKLEVEIDDEDLNGYLMYPKVFADYARATRPTARCAPCRPAPSSTAWSPARRSRAEIDPGKTLEIRLQPSARPTRRARSRVFFELNGQPRVIRVPDRKASGGTAAEAQGRAGNASHVGAPMPGVVASVAAQAGAAVKEGDLLLTIEAMKMETGIHAERDATVKAVHVDAGCADRRQGPAGRVRVIPATPAAGSRRGSPKSRSLTLCLEGRRRSRW